VNFDKFVDEYHPAVVDNFPKYYAIARGLSKVNAKQFKAFCEKIGADIGPVSSNVSSLMNSKLIEDTFTVKEYAFNSHILRNLLIDRIKKCPGIEIKYSEEVLKIVEGEPLEVVTECSQYQSLHVLNCTYAEINNIHRKSGIPLVPLKHEIAEMCLIELPENLKDFSITVMDGPFFSIMPFPTTPYHTLSHVRYTPHMSWLDNEETPSEMHDTYKFHEKYKLISNYRQMYADVVRYIPALAGMKFAKSIHDVKTILMKSEHDDSRPILFKPNFGFKGYTCIMGGKLDNIYDVFIELEGLYEKK
jgi:hypothetical protein